MTVLIYVDTGKQVGDVDHLKAALSGNPGSARADALISSSSAKLKPRQSDKKARTSRCRRRQRRSIRHVGRLQPPKQARRRCCRPLDISSKCMQTVIGFAAAALKRN